MAILNILKKGDDTLRKRSREVGEINAKIHTLLDDMAETMAESNGVGLAAPQVGVLRRVVVIDVGEGILELINPVIVPAERNVPMFTVIVATEGTQREAEGCLSIPGVHGIVERPAVVTVEALDRYGVLQRVEGTELLARAFCHEIDHLDGILFEDKVIEYVNLEESDEADEVD